MSSKRGGRCLGGHESSEHTHRHPRIRGRIGRRRPDPTPWGWEVPTAGLLTWLWVAGAGLLAAQAVAAWLTGHGWLWPDSPHLFPALGGLLTGHLGTGLDTPDGLPSPGPGRGGRGGHRAGAAGRDGVGGPLVLDHGGTRPPTGDGHPRRRRDRSRRRSAASGPQAHPPRPVRAGQQPTPNPAASTADPTALSARRRTPAAGRHRRAARRRSSMPASRRRG